MSGRGEKLLTDSEIRGAKPRRKVHKLRDGGGLHLLVTPGGSKLWRLRYGHGKTESMVSLGPYPDVSLSKARERASELRGGLIADHITPTAAKRAKRKAQANTFRAVAAEWFKKQRYSPATRTKVEWLLGLLYPHIGNKPVGALEPADILEVLRRIEAKGKHETAHRARSLVGNVVRYAIADGRAERDPTPDLRGALTSVAAVHHASITEPARVGELLRAIDAYRGRGAPSVAAALRLAPLVFVRPGELRGAEWSEFDLDSAEPTWRIPAARMKPVRGKREQHLVPLSRQAVAVLRDAQQHTGRGRLVFPSMRSRERPLSDNALNAALRSLGFTSEDMTAHGFRSMASTLLNEQQYNRDWIERQLAHGERNGVRGAYNYAEYLPDRRRMMQAWADYLDGLKADDGGKVVAIKRGHPA